MKRKVALLCLFSLALAALSGCWSSREINELAFIMGIAIDAGEAEGEFEITLQVANPGAINSSGESGSHDGEGSSAFINLSETGFGLEMPIAALALQCDRKLYSGHNQVIVISREVAERDIAPIIDFFVRNTDGRLTVSLFIAEGRAKDILSVTSALERLPAMHLKSLANSQRSFGEASEATMMGIVSSMQSQTSSAIIPLVHILETETGESRLALGGVAAFQNGKICMILPDEMARNVLSIKEKSTGEYFRLHALGGISVLKITASNVSLSAHFFEDKSLDKTTVTLHYDVSIVETSFTADILAQQTRNALALAAADYIEAEMQITLDYTKAHSADVFGFGEFLRRNHPKEAAHLLSDWHKAYPQLNVEFNVSVEILSSGSLTQSITATPHPQN